MKLLLLLVAALAAAASSAPTGKAISLFNVVTFRNVACDSTTDISNAVNGRSQRQGNCVTSSECSDAKGTSAGTCAAGFGICCLFEFNDEDETSFTVNRNNTYLQNPEFPTAYSAAETFTYTLEKAGDESERENICALRIDFEQLTLAPPANEFTACTDKFEISAITSNVAIPEICGDLTGQHIYLYLGREENAQATAKITTVGTATMRTWDLKVAQIECSNELLPPAGCLQYETDVAGTIKTFNFDSATNRHLPNQDYSVCVRRRTGYCCVEYQVCANEAMGFTLDTGGVATFDDAKVGLACTDYIGIVGGSQTGQLPFTTRYCGGFLNDIDTAAGSVPIKTCSSYSLQVFTNAAADAMAMANLPSKGACLQYRLLPC